jgi:hypothetical protein
VWAANSPPREGAARARETQVQDTVGQVAAQLETIQASIAGVLGAQAAEPATGSWTERALERARSASD